MTFWIVLGLMSVLSVAALAWPLLRRETNIGLDDQASQLAVMRDRRREIDDEQAAGRLTAEEAEEARNNLVESLAQALPAPDDADQSRLATSKGPRRILTAAAVAMLLPTLAFLVYQQVGEPMIGVSPHLVDADTPPSREEIDNMVAQVIKATEDTPEDGQAWLALGQVRQAQGDFEAAANAYGRAAALLPPNARLLAEQAEMQWLAQGRVFAGKPEQLLRKALTIEPGELKTNGLIAAYYMESGQQPAALPHLRVLLAAMSPDSQEGQQVGQLVDQIEANIREMTAGVGQPVPPSPSAQSPAAESTAQLSGRIELSESSVPEGAVLFISARAASGPRMPYAAVRIPNPTLPMDFSLSDANAMSPQRRLSDAGEVVVEARLSLSGNAIRQPGDRFGQSDAGSTTRQDLIITIDQTVP